MKVSIWQQFSSNHSNSFTVVGTFETEADAHLAYLQIRRVLRRIINAHKENPPNDEYGNYPSQAEIDILEPFGVVPKRLTDWTTYYIDESIVHDAVRVLDNHVVFCDPVTGWSGADTFVQLMATFTDKVIFTEEIELEDVLVVDIHCEAPDKQIAQIIYEALAVHQQNPSNRDSWGTQKPIAWLTHYDGEYNPEYEKWIAIEEQYLKHEWWRKKEWELNKTFKEVPKRERATFQEKIIAHKAQEPSEIGDDQRDIIQMRWKLQFRDYMGSISIEDKIIECKNLVFNLGSLNRGIPAIISWMRLQGCTVDYQFRITQFRNQSVITCRAVDEITAKRIVEEIKERQTKTLVLPEENIEQYFSPRNYYLNARDTVSSSFDEITIHFYDYAYPLQNSFDRLLRSLGCKRIRTQTIMIEKRE